MFFFLNKKQDDDTVKYAGFHDRMLANMIDFLILALLVLPLFAIFIPPHPQEINQLLMDAQRGLVSDAEFKDKLAAYFYTGGGKEKMLTDMLIQFGFVGVIFVLFWIYKSGTPGKMLIKLKIVDETTLEAPTKIQLIIRYLAYFVSFIPFCIGFAWVAFDGKKQGWHDKIAGTVVISTRKQRNRNKTNESK